MSVVAMPSRFTATTMANAPTATRDGRQEPGIRKPGLRRGGADEFRQRLGGESTGDQHHQCDNKIRQPQRQLAKHVGDGGKPLGVKGDHQHNQTDEPLGDARDRTVRVGLDPHLVDEVGEPGPLGQLVKLYRPEKRGHELADERGDEPPDTDCTCTFCITSCLRARRTRVEARAPHNHRRWVQSR